MSRPQTSNHEDRDVPSGYPSELEFDATSVERFNFRLRPIRPDDANALVEFHDHLSDRSCYLRFFSLHRHLSAKEVERFTRIDYRDRLALVAEHDGRLIAVGRYDRRPGTAEAEVAFVVADECQHHGIGSLLLDELAGAARDRGITTFVADTLEENLSMLEVFTHSGFSIARHCAYGTVSLSFPIALTPSYEAALARRRAGWRIAPTCAALLHEAPSINVAHVATVPGPSPSTVDCEGVTGSGPLSIVGTEITVDSRRG
jgi:GNAT superfamily N-acetyltransferase